MGSWGAAHEKVLDYHWKEIVLFGKQWKPERWWLQRAGEVALFASCPSVFGDCIEISKQGRVKASRKLFLTL